MIELPEILFPLLAAGSFVWGALALKSRSDLAKTLAMETRKNGEREVALLGELKLLREINSELERRIVCEMTTLSTVYEGSKRLAVESASELYPAALEFVMKILGGQGEIYLKKDAEWEVIFPTEKEAGSDEGLVKEAASIGDVVTGKGMMAGPIKAAGEVYAIMLVTQIPDFQINDALVCQFSFLLSWISEALEKTKDSKEKRYVLPFLKTKIV